MIDQLTTVAEKPLTKPGCRPHPRKDEFGRAHLVICCDFKQLPPATSRPPFIAANPAIMQKFRFRVLRQNRRIANSSDPEKQRDPEATQNDPEATQSDPENTGPPYALNPKLGFSSPEP